jgi:hypothetical protein
VCYLIYLSTTSKEPFGDSGRTLYKMYPIGPDDDARIVGLFEYPEKWYVECQYGGCSCHFRHNGTDQYAPSFSPPEDWCPEDEDDIEATAALVALFQRIIGDGHQLDVIDVWTGTPPELINTLDVNLSELPVDSFRFFENYRFRFLHKN